jgi:hypothetical protein
MLLIYAERVQYVECLLRITWKIQLISQTIVSLILYTSILKHYIYYILARTFT